MPKITGRIRVIDDKKPSKKKIWLDANTSVDKARLNEINTLNRKREFPFMIVDSSFDPEKIAKREKKIRKVIKR